MIESRQASQTSKLRCLVNKKLEGGLQEGITSFMKTGSFTSFFQVKSRSFKKSVKPDTAQERKSMSISESIEAS
jgi:hypothetical protein